MKFGSLVSTQCMSVIVYIIELNTRTQAQHFQKKKNTKIQLWVRFRKTFELNKLEPLIWSWTLTFCGQFCSFYSTLGDVCLWAYNQSLSSGIHHHLEPLSTTTRYRPPLKYTIQFYQMHLFSIIFPANSLISSVHIFRGRSHGLSMPWG